MFCYCADGVLFHLLMIDMYITIRCYIVLLSADTMKFTQMLTLEASKIIRDGCCSALRWQLPPQWILPLL